MIQKQFLFPEYYIKKIPTCDKCKTSLESTGTVLMSNPPLYVYKCPRCQEIYNIKEDDLQGEWKWRSI